MGLQNLIGGSIWDEYSQKVQALINHPLHTGVIRQDEAEAMGAKLVEVETQSIHLYFAISDEVIKTAKFQSADFPLMVACASALIELVVGKSVDEVLTISPSDIEKSLRDKHDTLAFPLGDQEVLETLDTLITQAIASYKGVDVDTLTIKELPQESQDEESNTMAFSDMSIVQKVKAVDKVIDEHIRAMLIADGGNMEILDIKVNGPHIDIYIRYLGACSGCASANTGTLFAIEGTLKKELDDNIRVLPI